MSGFPGAGTARRMAWELSRSPVVPGRLRQRMVRALGVAGLREVWISPRVTLVHPDEISCGPGTFINTEVYIDRQVTLGRNVYVGPRAMIVTASHPIGSEELRVAAGAPDPVVIGDGTWIGAGAMILPGTTIGSGCVIAAGAVVTEDCAPNGLYAGVPAVHKRDLPVGQGGTRLHLTAQSESDPEDPPVSVIIPARNAGRFIGEQLDALAAQVDPPRFEVVIGDNGSTDDTVSRARAHSAPFPVRIVDAADRASASFARNAAARAARGRVLAFCDADDLVEPDWLRELVRAFDAADGSIVAGALRHERFNSPEILAAYRIGDDPTPDPDALVEEARDFAGYLPTVAGCNFAMSRADYLRIGGMDPSFPGGSEETDLVWRAQQAGMSVISAPRALVNYRLRSDSRAVFRQQRIQQRARILLWRRFSEHMNGPSWKASLLEIARQGSRLPRAAQSRGTRLDLAYTLGAHVGAVEGMVRYRLLGRTPDRRLMTGTDVPGTTAPRTTDHE